jgi:hypothetical protein
MVVSANKIERKSSESEYESDSNSESESESEPESEFESNRQVATELTLINW